MKYNLSYGRKAALGVSMLTLLISSLTADATNLDGRWIQHPAAALRSRAKESQVDRIIEGNRYVYFCVRGLYFDRNEKYTTATRENLEPREVFVYDKRQPWKAGSITALAREYELSGNGVLALNYFPKAGVLAVVHDNNSIDFIYDDGTLISSQALINASLPKQTFTPYTVSFDETKPLVYVAGSFGYVAINRQTGEAENFVYTDKAVSWVARMGDNMVLFAGEMSPTSYRTDTYMIPATFRGSLTLANPLTGIDSNLQALMPLSDTKFAAITAGNDVSGKSLNLYTLEGNEVKETMTLAGGLTVDNGALPRYRHMFHTDGYFQHGADGYVIHSKETLLLLNSNGETRTIAKSTLTDNEKSSKAASIDGSRLWLYTYETNGVSDSAPRGFYRYENTGDTWSGKSATVTPNAPSSTLLYDADWNPNYGLLARGPGSFLLNDETDDDRLCGYKDGIWTDLNYSALYPAYVPLTRAANFVKSDPLNPDWIWGTSKFAGLHRVNIHDNSNYLGLGSNYYSSYKNSYPGYFPIFEYQNNWVQVITFSNVDFDRYGNMWFSRYYYTNGGPEDYNSNDILNARSPIYFLTEEERLQIADIGADQSQLPDILGRELSVPRANMSDNFKILALKSEANKNYLALAHCFMTYTYRKAIIYDHNGTPGNKEDDRYAILDGLHDENNDLMNYWGDTGLYEDMNNGDLWYLTTAGPFILNPKEILDGNMTCRRLKITRRDGMEVNENPFEQVSIRYVADDYLGRKWLATEKGLYCLSKDAQEILGHYTVSNSPIPSDDVYNVICTPEGGIFTFTAAGLAEFHPEGSMTQIAAGTSLNMWPSSVAPDYNGYVTVTGAETGSEYVVCDKDGNVVVSLGQPDSTNSLQWDAKNASGAKVPAGRYNIKRRNVEENNTIIIL